MEKTITLLENSAIEFPCAEQALEQPNGLLAVGGNLEVDTLLKAYRRGIFPWFNEGDPVLWWSPSPRMVFRPGELHLSRSLKKLLRKQLYRVTLDHDFSGVIRSCAELRQDSEGTWITGDMLEAYQAMHAAGHAHSVEVWSPDGLVGGLYGIVIGQVFFGESMFSRASNTSKIAMAALSLQLADWDFKLCDCQVYSAHLESLGAWAMPREEFMECLDRYCPNPPSGAHWKQEWQWNDQSP